MVTIGETAQIASAIFSLGLLGATAAYAYYTRQSIRAQASPHLKPGIEYGSAEQLYLVIRNTGNAAAHDVEARWSLLRPAGRGRTWRIETIPPSGRHRFKLPFPGSEETEIENIKERLSGTSGALHFEAECKNILGQTKGFEEKVQVKDALRRTAEADEIVQPGELEEIKNVIVELTDALERAYEEE
jgi:hypothetical protein